MGRSIRKDEVYDPYYMYADLEFERKELKRIAEVKSARSRNQEARGSEKVENSETTRGKVQTLGDSRESGTEGGTHDIRRRTYRKKGKLQQDGKKKKKRVNSKRVDSVLSKILSKEE